MQNHRYADSFNAMVSLCQEKNVAIQTIQAIARRPWGTRSRTYNLFFYEPLDSQDAIEKAVHWAMGFPDSFVISAGDMQLLPRMLEAASRFERIPTDAEMGAMVAEYDIRPIFPGW
jgi:hypothetical protein